MSKNTSVIWAMAILPMMMFFSFSAVCVIFKKIRRTVADYKTKTNIGKSSKYALVNEVKPSFKSNCGTA